MGSVEELLAQVCLSRQQDRTGSTFASAFLRTWVLEHVYVFSCKRMDACLSTVYTQQHRAEVWRPVALLGYRSLPKCLLVRCLLPSSPGKTKERRFLRSDSVQSAGRPLEGVRDPVYMPVSSECLFVHVAFFTGFFLALDDTRIHPVEGRGFVTKICRDAVENAQNEEEEDENGNGGEPRQGGALGGGRGRDEEADDEDAIVEVLR